MNLGTVHTAALAPRRRLVASYSLERGIRVWHLDTQRLVAELAVTSSQTIVHHPLAFSSSGARLGLWLPHERAILVWSLENGRSILLRHPDVVEATTLAFSPDERFLAAPDDGSSPDPDGPARFGAVVWDREGAVVLQTHAASPVTALAFDPASERLLTADEVDFEAWELAPGTRAGRWPHGAGTPESLCFSPSGERFAVGGCDDLVRIWDTPSAAPRRILPHGDDVEIVEFSDDGAYLLTSADGVRVFDAEGRAQIVVEAPVAHAGFVGNTIVAIARDGEVTRVALAALFPGAG
ncbi:MAG: WD40 repeat domain-containing protein [Labilithrix sp.]|nr:WD40 repeat domain-containing protein [Labilithrix sp.]